MQSFVHVPAFSNISILQTLRKTKLFHTPLTTISISTPSNQYYATTMSLSPSSPSPSPTAHSEAAWASWRRLGSPKYVVAPMVDGSELAFRDLCRRYNAQLAYTPMLHSRTFSKDAKFRKEYFTSNVKDRPLVAQFCANDPDIFVNAARHIQHEVDAVDLNLGCPQGIAKKGRYGAFLQDEWDLVYKIVNKAYKELDVPVWVKIRIFDDLDKTISYAKMLESAGASLIAVHGRTREQKGKVAPPANWAAIRAVREAVSVPVIANGNVRCKEDADNAIKETGAVAVMSAWALLDNPSTFKDNIKVNRLHLAREYLQIAEEYKTPVRMVRLHLFKLFRSRLDVNMDLNEAVARCRTFDDFNLITGVLEHRCDFDGVSFEERVATGAVPENVVCEKKIERRRAAAENAQKQEMKNTKGAKKDVAEDDNEYSVDMNIWKT